LNCPFCGYIDSKVIDSRDVNDGVRRRRQCLRCDLRFTTYERLQPVSLFVIKKDGRREEFRREKLLTGIRKACEKRPLPSGAVDKLVDEIEGELYQTGKAEIPGAVIGDMVMAKLKKLDHIAYIRFASVYREFADISALKQAVDTLVSGEPASAASTAQLPLLPADKLVDEIEGELYQTGRAEIPGAVIGDMVMAKLKKLDHIAYIRFASVYREFADITALKEEVDSLAGHATAPPADQLPLIPPEVLPVTVKAKRRVRQ
jgi:transcriptional repressor NrdR